MYKDQDECHWALVTCVSNMYT